MTAPLILMLAVLTLGLLYVWMRRIETVRGIRIFESKRAKLDLAAQELSDVLIQGGIPISWRKYGIAVLHEVTHVGVRAAVESVRAVERPLARLSYKLRVSAPKGTGAPVSDFLRTLTPEKK